MSKPKAKTRKPRMTVNQKRVAIARDVIKQLKGGLMTACHLYLLGPIQHLVNNASGSQDVRDLVRHSGIKEGLCDVCAKGALLVAHILRFDKMTCEELRYAEGRIGSHSPIQYFTDDQFNLIECLYERKGGDLRRFGGRNTRAWMTFYHEIDDLHDADRIIAIMREIIRRKGVI